MAATKCNYLVIYDDSPQVYSASTLETLLNTPPPKNYTVEDRTVLFVTYFPDSKEVRVFKVTADELQAEKEEIDRKIQLRDEKRRAKQQKEQEESSEVIPLPE